MLHTLWGPHRENMLPKYEVLFSKDDWFRTAGAFYWPTLSKRGQQHSLHIKTQEAENSEKTRLKFRWLKMKWEYLNLFRLYFILPGAAAFHDDTSHSLYILTFFQLNIFHFRVQLYWSSPIICPLATDGLHGTFRSHAQYTKRYMLQKYLNV